MGLHCAWFSEIEPFPSAVLAHHFPDIPNLGDFTKIGNKHGRIDILVGGTPCQSFSVAGKRAGLDDPRGNLAIEFARLAQRLRPRWLVWENVPGVLSIDGGRTFGTFLGMLGQLGYGFAYRVLDAQYFGVAQRRRRVFVVGCLGDWRAAAAVLFERESLSGNPAPSREKREGIARGVERGTASGKSIFGTLAANVGTKLWLGNQEALSGDFHVIEPIAFSAKDHRADAPILMRNREGCEGGGKGPLLSEDQSLTLAANANDQVLFHAMAIRTANTNANGHGVAEEVSHTLDGAQGRAVAFTEKSDSLTAAYGTKWNGNASADNGSLYARQGMAVRRLTPRECERLQRMEDDYTLIPWRGKMAPDGPRYKAIGNSWAVPVLNWLAGRIIEADKL